MRRAARNSNFIWFSLGALFTNAITMIREGDAAWGASFLAIALALAFFTGWLGRDKEKR